MPSSTTAVPGLTNNVVGLLCYLLGAVGGVVFLLIAPYNQDRTVRFHAFQSIFLTIAWVIFWIVLNAVIGILHLYVLYFLTPLVGLGALILWVYLMLSTYQGKRLVLPVVGPLAEQQAGPQA
ncbi:MAG: hypothetical protein WC273_04990 [Dehalococcoidia bacterium]